MTGQVNHLRDDIRKMFTRYALIPVFIIFMISLTLACISWNKNILERNHETRTLGSEALTTIIGSYMEKELEIAGYCDLQALLTDKNAQTQMYRQLYDQVNILHAGADFYVVDSELRLLISSKPAKPEFMRLPREIAWGIIGEARKNKEKAVLGFVRDDGNFQGRNLAVGKAILKRDQIDGYIIFVIPGSYLLRAVTNPYVQFVIADQYDYVPLAMNYAFCDTTMNKLSEELRDANGFLSYQKEQYYITNTKILDGELRVYAITPIGGLVGQYMTALAVLIGVLFILTATVVISVRRQTIEKTKVIDQLVEAFDAAEQGNLDIRLEIRTNNEFEIIAESYNTMVASLKNLMRINHEKAKETVISEIKQLESQFNPHFLFNTLENIKFMIKLDPAAASKMIVALSSLLRYSIDHKIGEVTVRADIGYTRNYLDIQKLRFGERLDYVVKIADEAWGCIIPKLIVQPLIENAIKYGTRQCARIRVEAGMWVEDNHLVILIFNSGTGMDEQELAEIHTMLAAELNTTRHTGLYNVNRRIKLMYGFQYGLEIMSEKNTGTTVRIVLPANK